MAENGSEWTANQWRFIHWLALPSDEREPHTHAEFAESIGVAERTVFRWKDKPGLTEAAAEIARERVTGELPDIYGSLIGKAKKGSYHHIRLCLEVAGHYVEKKVMTGDEDAPIRHKHEHKHEHEVDLSMLSDAELDFYERIITKAHKDSRGGAFPNPN